MNHELVEIKRLYANIGKLITSSLKLEDILEQLMKEVNVFFSPHHWSLLRYDSQTEELFFILSQDLDMEIIKHIRLHSGEGIAGYAVQNQQSLCVLDAQNDPRFSNKIDKLTGFETGSVLAVPIIYLGTVYGVIELVKPRKDSSQYTEDDQLILETIADFAAISFANSTAFSLLIDLSEMDTLTGFYNQHKLEKTIVEMENNEHKHRSADKEKFVLVIFIDLDDFKNINDSFGHSTGDRVLREFASRMRSVIRNNDRLYRIGGDEFLILMEVDTEDKLDHISQRLEVQFSNINPFTVGKDIQVGFSFGVVQGARSEVRKLIHEADMMMYKHKNTGKQE